MRNKLASAVTLYTPSHPVSHAEAEAIRSLVEGKLARLAQEVDQLLGASVTTERGEGEEEVIIITTPPPR